MNDVEFMLNALCDFFQDRLDGDHVMSLQLRTMFEHHRTPCVVRAVRVTDANTGKPALVGSLLISLIRVGE